MLKQDLIDQAKEKINQANSIIVALPSNPDEDALASGLGLFLTLKQLEKNVHIGCSSPLTVESSNLYGLDQITNNIGNKNLIITLDYPEESLEKIDYNPSNEGKNIELHVIPRPGQNPPNGDQIHINFAGASADLVITVGTDNLEELGKLYADEKEFFDATPFISFSLKNIVNPTAVINLNAPNTSSLAEVIAYFLKQTEFIPGSDPAHNLLKLLVKTSDRFASPKTSPDTLEVAAFLMRQITIAPGNQSKQVKAPAQQVYNQSEQ